MISCRICNKDFDSERGLHGHLKQHCVTMAEYYTEYFPRKNKLTGDPLPFKNKKDYFSKDFSSRAQLLKWCGRAGKEELGEYALKMLRQRVESKGLKRAPSHLELKISELPDVDSFVRAFGSYTSACNLVGVPPLFGKRLPESFLSEETEGLKVFIDTREQKPLVFSRSERMKLDFGDYTAAGDDYSYTYIDRKSAGDFVSTLSLNNLNRFKREVSRARELDCYLFVLVESDLEKIYKRNKWGPHSSNLRFIYHNMREVSHQFADSCQFVFTGSRENSEFLIPKILKCGLDLWGVDLQYYIDCHGLGNR